MKNAVLTAALLAGSALSVQAQVAPGDGVRFNISTSALKPGFQLMDFTAGSATLVGGAAGKTHESGVLDPITGDLIMGGADAFTGMLVRFHFDGTGSGVQTLIADTGSQSEIVAVDIGPQGNYWFTDGSMIWWADRNTGATFVWDSTFAGGMTQIMTLGVDRGTGQMWIGTRMGSTRTIREYDINFGWVAANTIVDFGTAGVAGKPTGIDSIGGGKFYFSTDAEGSDSIYGYNGASVFTVTGAPQSHTADLNVDATTGLLHYVQSITNTAWNSLDMGTGVTTQVHPGWGIPGGKEATYPTAMVINDLRDLTSVFPTAPSASGGFTFEAAAHGSYLDTAGVAVTAINGSPIIPLILGTPGLCDKSGFYSVTLPIAPGAFPAGINFDITTGVIDSATGILTMGTTQTVTLGL